MGIAWRNLVQDKVRLALSVTGIALAVMLILVLNGFLTGMNQQIAGYLDHAPGTIVVAQADVSDLLGPNSRLPAGTEAAARAVPGVARVVPILAQYVNLDLHGKKLFTFLVGYEPARGGGPWRLLQGREPQADDEVVFDQVLARQHDLGLNDTIQVLDRPFRVVGLSTDTASWMMSFFFMRKRAMESLLRAPGATSFLLVTAAPEGDLAALHARLARLPGANAVPKADVIANDVDLFGRSFSIPLRVMVAIAFLVGTLVVGLVIYTATMERQREYGVLKAVGARSGLLYRVVTAQALGAAGAGAAAGVTLAYLAAELIMALRPQFRVALDWPAVAGAFAAGLGMALLAALVPLRLLSRLAPADVFRR